MRAAVRRLHARAPSFPSPGGNGVGVGSSPDAPFQDKGRPAPCVERVMGIEPTSSAWKAEVLPLNYTRGAFCRYPPASPEPNPTRPALVEGVGFEPTKAEPPDLQSGPFGRSGTPPQRKRGIVLQGSNGVKQRRASGSSDRRSPAAGCRRDTGTAAADRDLPRPDPDCPPGRERAERIRGRQASPADEGTARRARPPGCPAPASSRNATAPEAAATSGSIPPSRRTGARRGCRGRRRG